MKIKTLSDLLKLGTKILETHGDMEIFMGAKIKGQIEEIQIHDLTVFVPLYSSRQPLVCVIADEDYDGDIERSGAKIRME